MVMHGTVRLVEFLDVLQTGPVGVSMPTPWQRFFTARGAVNVEYHHHVCLRLRRVIDHIAVRNCTAAAAAAGRAPMAVAWAPLEVP